MEFLTCLFRISQMYVNSCPTTVHYLLPPMPTLHPSPPTLCPLTPSSALPLPTTTLLPVSTAPTRPPSHYWQPQPTCTQLQPLHLSLQCPPTACSYPLRTPPPPFNPHNPIHHRPRFAPSAHPLLATHHPLPPTTTTHERDSSHLG